MAGPKNKRPGPGIRLPPARRGPLCRAEIAPPPVSRKSSAEVPRSPATSPAQYCAAWLLPQPHGFQGVGTVRVCVEARDQAVAEVSYPACSNVDDGTGATS